MHIAQTILKRLRDKQMKTSNIKKNEERQYTSSDIMIYKQIQNIKQELVGVT